MLRVPASEPLHPLLHSVQIEVNRTPCKTTRLSSLTATFKTKVNSYLYKGQQTASWPKPVTHNQERRAVGRS